MKLTFFKRCQSLTNISSQLEFYVTLLPGKFYQAKMGIGQGSFIDFHFLSTRSKVHDHNHSFLVFHNPKNQTLVPPFRRELCENQFDFEIYKKIEGMNSALISWQWRHLEGKNVTWKMTKNPAEITSLRAHHGPKNFFYHSFSHILFKIMTSTHSANLMFSGLILNELGGTICKKIIKKLLIIRKKQ